jgi:hypothetical protein
MKDIIFVTDCVCPCCFAAKDAALLEGKIEMLRLLTDEEA